VENANAFAYAALLAWIPVSILAFRSFRPALAASLVLLGGMLFLPDDVAFDAPAVPPLGKDNITTLCLLAGAMLSCRDRLAKARPGRGPDLLILGLIASGIVTAALNTDRPVYGGHVATPMSLYDSVSMGIRSFLRFGLPFFLGRALFRSSRDLRELLTLLAAAGLLYSLLALIEVRLSPQLHNWIYGFHPNPFRLSKRTGGGFRPMVFMPGGIALGIFFASSTLAAATLWKARLPIFRVGSGLASGYLLGILVLCRSLAALVYSAALVPLIMLCRPRQLAGIALLLCALIASYPVIRATGLFPTGTLVDLARSYDEQRAVSLAFRFDNEDQILAKARERLLFGWGSFGRNQVRSEETGAQRSTSDGFWIIILSSRGLVGWACVFGLLLLPPVFACRRLGRIPSRRDQVLVVGLVMIVVMRSLDMLPNGFYTSLPLFLAGTLLGVIPSLTRKGQRSRGFHPRPSPPALKDP
jgi:hypothetical protein